jgi:DNA-binding NarL/FixJ family response regulator
MVSTVVVVDDDPGFRSLAAQLLTAGGFTVVGAAGDARQAVALSRRLHPDIVLLDIQMPGRDGFWVAGQLLDDATPPRVVLTSGRGGGDYGYALTRCPGITGFLPKADVSGAALRHLLDMPS